MSEALDIVDEAADEVMPSDNVCDLVEYMVASLVDNPDAIVIDVTDSDESSLIEVHVDPEDVGKVVGRRWQGDWPSRSRHQVDSHPRQGLRCPRRD